MESPPDKGDLGGWVFHQRNLTRFFAQSHRSEYIPSSGDIQKFKEGKVSPDSRTRMKHIKDSFEAGFLDKVIFNLKHGKITIPIAELDQENIDNITVMVESVTSEVGRALVGLMVMQLSMCMGKDLPSGCQAFSSPFVH